MTRLLAKTLRWLLLTFLGLLVLLVAAVELISWNFLKQPIESRFEITTGRSLAINGELSLGLFPRPHAIVNDVAVDNPEWGEAADMIEVELIRLRPSLSALLKGRLVLSQAHIETPTVHLEQRLDGSPNWAFPKLQGPQAGEHAGVALIIRQLTLSSAHIHYRAIDGKPLSFAIASIELRDDGQSMSIAGSLSFRQREFRLQAKSDSISALQNNGARFDGELSVQAQHGRFDASFILEQPPRLQPALIDWKLQLQNFADWSRWLGQAPIELGSVSLASRLEYQAGKFRFSDIDANFLGNRLTGHLDMDMAKKSPGLSGSLHSPEFDAKALRAALPNNGEHRGGSIAMIPLMPNMSAKLELSIDTLLLDRYRIQGLNAGLALKDRTLAVELLKFDIAGGGVEATAELVSNSEVLALSLDASVRRLDLARFNANAGPAGILSGELALSLPCLQRHPAPDIETVLERLRIERATASYRNDARALHLQAALESKGRSAARRISLTGDLQGRPIQGRLSGDPLPALTADLEDYALKARVTSGTVMARVNTSLASILQPQTATATFELTADNVLDLQPWLQRALPSVPDFRAAGKLERKGQQWAATGLKFEAGASSVNGEIHLRNAERPFIKARLHASRFDPWAWTVDTDASSEQADKSERDADTATATGTLMRAALRSVDGQFDLRIDRLNLPGDLDMQQLIVSGTLEAGNARIDPLRFDMAKGRVMAMLKLEVRQQRAFGRIEAQFDEIVLNRLGKTFTPLEERLGKLSGELNVDITEPDAGELRDDLVLPFIGRVRFEESRLRFEDPEAKTDLTLTLQTSGLSKSSQSFHIDGQGRYDGEPFALKFRGDELLRVRDPDRSYALELSADIVESQINLSGTVLRPLALKGLDLEVSLQGPNPQRLGRILGIAFPLLPSYSVSANLSLDEMRWALQNLEGQVGDSDLSGRLGLDISVLPPRLNGRLQSDSVTMRDLSGVFGYQSDADLPQSEDAGGSGPIDRFILPQQPLIDDAWREVVADVRYRGRSVRAGDVPLSDVVIDFLLEDGQMRFAPVGFGVGDGGIDFTLDLDVSQRISQGTLEATVHGVNLRKVLREWELAADSIGIIGGRGKFWVQGASIAELLASADGGLLMLMHGGRLDAMLVELAGLDAAQMFTSWLRQRDPIPIDCAYIDMKARDGLATLDTFVIDTDDTIFTAGGEVDLDDERLDITILAHPKDPSVGVGPTPLRISGAFNNIDAGIEPGALGMRASAAVVLGTLASPLAALLPLLEVGTGEDSGYCQGLARRSHQAIKNREGQR
ncbi:MAG: AsmA family protein [Wenzhouxiangellaceae bacterium]|nr:AsmA family protein [Wenzhouxiangellaceae bacterium]